MNCKERSILVLEGKTPDRVPLFEVLVDKEVINKIRHNSLRYK